MAKRADAPERKARAAREAASHGGLVALDGGPASGRWWWRDEYERQPESSRVRAGYVETAERVDNRAIIDPHGVNLTWYGQGVAWRFDPALAPSAPTSDPDPSAWLTTPAYCACGTRLLLVQPGRTECECCRLGIPRIGPPWIHEPGMNGPREPELELDPPADPDPDDPDDHASDRQPMPVASPTEPPRPSAEEAAAFVWQCLAPHYDDR